MLKYYVVADYNTKDERIIMAFNSLSAANNFADKLQSFGVNVVVFDKSNA